MPDRKRWFVGLRSGKRTIFSCHFIPRPDTHGWRFGAVVGPYNSKREAISKIALM